MIFRNDLLSDDFDLVFWQNFLSLNKPVILKIYMLKPEHFLAVIMTKNLAFQNR